MLGRLGWQVLGTVARIHPALWFAVLWVAIALLAHYAHIYAGDQGFRLHWVPAILAGFGLSSVAMFVWWVTTGRK